MSDISVGSTYGSRTVVGESQRSNKSRQKYWKVVCSCGVESEVSGVSLKKGRANTCPSCRGSKVPRGTQSNLWRGGTHVPGVYVAKLKSRGREFGITIEYIDDLYVAQNKKCAYTKLPISFEESTASLDRIDSSKGYVKGNVQWVHKDINRMKMSLSEDRFVELCRLVADERSAYSGV